MSLRRLAAVASLAILALGAAACGGNERDPAADPSPGAPTTLRLGYFANITHAQALVGVADGTFQAELGDVKLETKIFNAGPAEIDALFAGELDAGFIGPSPAINGYVKSKGDALRIVSGAASGGALFVVHPGANIRKPADLAGKTLATPQLGGTQDVALRTYLRSVGLKTRDKGGNVLVTPLNNADTLARFKQGQLDGAWVPEPWATRLVLEGGGQVFLDEKSLWPNGDFATTQIIVSRRYLERHPGAVEALIRGHLDVTQRLNADPEGSKKLVNAEIKRLTTASLSPQVLDRAWANLAFTPDPLAATLVESAEHAYALGFLGRKRPDLSGIYDLTILNHVLASLGQPQVRKVGGP